ncbi:MAG: C40 family peptidase [Treponema sp.]|nr:C40 family peptidase [Treponema sp.]
MPIKLIVKVFISVLLFFCTYGLFASPLESGYALAPRASASQEEKDLAYRNARIRVVEASRKYLGVPYRYGGMSTAGLDCSGFLGLAFNDALGVSLPRSASALYSWTVRIPIERAQPGDFVFFRTGNTSSITHVGLYLGDRRFIHAASAGSQTGVIYSSLDEQYYVNTYAGAGRAFPESAPFSVDTGSTNTAAARNNSSSGNSAASNTASNRQTRTAEQSNTNNRNNSNTGSGPFLFGVSAAPIWLTVSNEGVVFGGFSAQVSFAVQTDFLGSKMSIGLDVRPEFDSYNSVFYLPVTLSLGLNEYISIFGGPVFSFGNPLFVPDNGFYYYFGMTITPVSFKTNAGEFSPYFQASMQSDFKYGSDYDFAADISKNLRFTTGVRWVMRLGS